MKGARIKGGEVALAARVVAWLEAQHWDVYQEVQHCGDVADIVAVRAGLVWAIECKTSLSLTVMEQASRWRTPFRSIAVPWARRADDRALAERICKDFLQIGVLYVDTEAGGAIRERVPPPLMRPFYRAGCRLRQELRPEHKTAAPAGTNTGGRFTPYQQTMSDIRAFLAARRPTGATLKEIIDSLDGRWHYANSASAKSSIPHALDRWESGWCEQRGEGRGRRYYLKGAL